MCIPSFEADLCCQSFSVKERERAIMKQEINWAEQESGVEFSKNVRKLKREGFETKKNNKKKRIGWTEMTHFLLMHLLL